MCIPMPGCTHGHCDEEAFKCVCDDETKYTGALCDQRELEIALDISFLRKERQSASFTEIC